MFVLLRVSIGGRECKKLAGLHPRFRANFAKPIRTYVRASAKGWSVDVGVGFHNRATSIRRDHRSSEQLPNDMVFTNEAGSWVVPALVSKRFHKLRENAGLRRIRPHDLRHTHATLLLKSGVNPKVVQERLGHESIAITLDLYGHVLPSMGREVADLVGRMLSPR